MSVRLTISDDDKPVKEWVRVGMKLAVQSVLHPIEYSKVLIQVSNFQDCINDKYLWITLIIDWLRADSF